MAMARAKATTKGKGNEGNVTKGKRKGHDTPRKGKGKYDEGKGSKVAKDEL